MLGPRKEEFRSQLHEDRFAIVTAGISTSVLRVLNAVPEWQFLSESCFKCCCKAQGGPCYENDTSADAQAVLPQRPHLGRAAIAAFCPA